METALIKILYPTFEKELKLRLLSEANEGIIKVCKIVLVYSFFNDIVNFVVYKIKFYFKSTIYFKNDFHKLKNYPITFKFKHSIVWDFWKLKNDADDFFKMMHLLILNVIKLLVFTPLIY